MTKGDELTVELQNGRTITVIVDNESECRSCGEPVIWCLTASGRRMPVDVPDDDEKATVSHFASCPQSEEWRKKK